MIKPYLVHTHTLFSVKHMLFPKQMGSKAKHGAKGLAKAKAKASIAKANVGCLAKAKSKAKGASSSRCTKELGTRGGKGWDSIQEDQPMGQLGGQTVKGPLEAVGGTRPYQEQ